MRSWYLDWICKTLKNDIDYLHTFDDQIICGAGIPETIQPVFTGLKLPPPETRIIEKFYPGGVALRMLKKSILILN
jgi:hypothetical protein